MKKLIFILFLVAVGPLNAQLIQVSGYIYQRSDSSVALPDVAIINKRTKGGTKSSADGFYTILLAPGDSVEVSLLGFKTQKFTLPVNIGVSSFHKNVYMKDDYIILDPYAVNALTWKKFKEVFTAMEPVTEKKWVIIDKQETDKSPVNATPHLTLNGPISWLYGKLSRKAKELDKLDDLRNGENKDVVSVQRITDDYVMKATGLPKEYVNPFLEYCHNDNYFYAQASDHDIMSRFESCLPGFKKHYNLQDSPPTDTIKSAPHQE
jgi:hypothetical protein